MRYNKLASTIYSLIRPKALVASSAALAGSLLLATPASDENEPALTAELQPSQGDKLFSFKAVDMDLKQALAVFAESNDLNIIPDQDIEGSVTVSFRELPLDLAMEALLDAHGYYFVKTRQLIRVRNFQTRIFQIDYINSVRSGSGSNEISFSSGGENDEGSSMNVSADATIDFWASIQEQLSGMISEGGNLTVNSLAGVISVTDRYARMKEIATFIENIGQSVIRQVELEVEIYEVSLSDTHALGIDWTRVSQKLDATFTGDLIVSNSSVSSGFAPSTLGINFARGGTTALLEALDEQGDVSVLSKPKLRTLNNQPAVIRVGQDLPVFRQNVTIVPGPNPITTTEEEVENITIGTVLSITPQISSDDIVTLEVSPAISRLLRNEISAVTGAAAPVIDVRQASSIVRIRDGKTVVLGGLVQTEDSKINRRVPIIGNIPVLGRAFRGSRHAKTTNELVVVLTPRISR